MAAGGGELSTEEGHYDRLADLESFDGTRAGVHGLVASGAATAVPRIFRLPEDDPLHAIPTSTASSVPVVDLSRDRPLAVEQVRRAAEEWGFFQVVGHGVPREVTEGMLEGTKRFHEGDLEVKREMYSRENLRKVKYSSNFDLFQSRVANWRDSLFCNMAPEAPQPEEIPASCRDIMIEYSKHMSILGELLFGLLSEALGLNTSYLKDMECCRGQNIICHYYPPCPEPELTIGTSRHTDTGFLNALLQDQLGGLQVLHKGHWLITNDRFTSVEHRVLASKKGPRVSVACFFTMHFNSLSTRLYGPIKELLSESNPPLYKEILIRDYITYFYAKGLTNRKVALEHFKLQA